MQHRPQSHLLSYLRYVTGLWRDDPRSDGELLAAFAETRDESVFAALVGRHGEAVWRGCAAVLGNTPEAEDVFQAVFMALARKAPELRREALGGWLSTISRRLALNTRRTAGRRDRLAAVVRPRTGEEPQTRLDDEERRRVVAEELAALPEKLHAPLTLYYLEGKTQADVARVLNISERAVRDRLNRGLQTLRTRLANRGLAVTAAVVAALLCPLSAARAASVRLLADTASAATRYATDPGSATGRAAELAARLVAPRLPVWPIVAVVALVGLTSTIAVAALSTEPERPAPPIDPPPVVVAPVKVPRTFHHDGAVTAVVVSSDGKRVASAGIDRLVRVWDRETGREVVHFDAPAEGVKALVFTPDSSALVVESPKAGLNIWELAPVRRRYNLLGQVSGLTAMAFAPDGKHLVSIGRDGKFLSLDLSQPSDRETSKDRLREQVTKSLARLDEPIGPPAPPKAIRVGVDYAVAFTPDSGAVYAVDRKLDITRLNYPSRRMDRLALTGPKSDIVHPVSAVALAPDASRVAWGNGDHKIGFVNLTRPGKVQLVRGHKAPVVVLTFSADGGMLASADTAGGVARWILPAPGVEFEGRSLQGPIGITSLAFSPDGQCLYGGGVAGKVWCWDAKTMKLIGPRPEKGDKPEGE
jgi:RNA polymerase sigma factor (sigma-70 family)